MMPLLAKLHTAQLAGQPHGLYAAWLDAGADVVSGTAGINYMPSGYGPFLDAWVAGADFNTAVMNAFSR